IALGVHRADGAEVVAAHALVTTGVVAQRGWEVRTLVDPGGAELTAGEHAPAPRTLDPLRVAVELQEGGNGEQRVARALEGGEQFPAVHGVDEVVGARAAETDAGQDQPRYVFGARRRGVVVTLQVEAEVALPAAARLAGQGDTGEQTAASVHVVIL